MYRKLIALGFVLGVPAALVAFAQPADKPETGGEETGPKAELRSAFARYSEALANKDLEGCVAFYASDAVMLGTGPGERWVGPEEIGAAHEQFFNNFDKETTTVTWIQSRLRGDTAYLAAQVAVTDYLKNVKNEFFLNISIVLENQDGQWKMTLFHFSNVTGGE